MTLRLATALPDTAWESRLVTAYGNADSTVRVVRRTVETAELLSVALAGLADAVLVSARLPQLDSEAVSVMGLSGIAVVLAVPAGDEAAARRAHALHPTAVVEVGADPGDVAVALRAAVDRPVRRYPVADPHAEVLAASGAGASDLPCPREPFDAIGLPSRAPCSPASGTVFAVWGPTGAPGRTTTAVALTESLAQQSPTVLIDVDPYGGAVAQTVGMLDEGSGFLDACRQAALGRLDAAGLRRLGRSLPSGGVVLTGYSRTGRWPEATGSAVESLLAVARSAFTYVVVDCGFSLDEDEVLSFDSVAPQRNAATLRTLALADRVIAVTGSDPVSLHRMVRGLAQLREAVGTTTPLLVVNRMGGPAAGSREDVSGLLTRFAGVTPQVFLPHDPSTLGRALAEGRTPLEAGPRSAYMAAVRALAELVAPGCGAGPERRFHRRRRRNMQV